MASSSTAWWPGGAAEGERRLPAVVARERSFGRPLGEAGGHHRRVPGLLAGDGVRVPVAAATVAELAHFLDVRRVVNGGYSVRRRGV